MTNKNGWQLRLYGSWIFGLALMMWAGTASAKWYMVVGTLPNLIQVVDTTTDKVVRTIPLEGPGPILQVLLILRMPRYAYA